MKAVTTFFIAMALWALSPSISAMEEAAELTPKEKFNAFLLKWLQTMDRGNFEGDLTEKVQSIVHSINPSFLKDELLQGFIGSQISDLHNLEEAVCFLESFSNPREFYLTYKAPRSRAILNAWLKNQKSVDEKLKTIKCWIDTLSEFSVSDEKTEENLSKLIEKFSTGEIHEHILGSGYHNMMNILDEDRKFILGFIEEIQRSPTYKDTFYSTKISEESWDAKDRAQKLLENWKKLKSVIGDSTTPQKLIFIREINSPSLFSWIIITDPDFPPLNTILQRMSIDEKITFLKNFVTKYEKCQNWAEKLALFNLIKEYPDGLTDERSNNKYFLILFKDVCDYYRRYTSMALKDQFNAVELAKEMNGVNQSSVELFGLIVKYYQEHRTEIKDFNANDVAKLLCSCSEDQLSSIIGFIEGSTVRQSLEKIESQYEKTLSFFDVFRPKIFLSALKYSID